MPETDEVEKAARLVLSADNYASLYRGKRDEAIREAHKAGSTLSELARITGLSRAQVQRICDYSKDRGQ